MTDWRAVDDLDSFGEDTESDEEDLEQDCIHRIDTPRAANPDDPDLGLGADNFLSGTPDTDNFAQQVSNELRKDGRIDSVETSIALTTDSQNGSTYEIDVEIDTSDTTIALALAAGPNGVTQQ